MNHDVDEETLYLPQHHKTAYFPRSGTRQQPHLLSRIRNFNNLAITSIGSLFSTPPTPNLGSFIEGIHGNTDQRTGNWDYEFDLENAHTPTASDRNDRLGNQGYYDVREIEIVDTSTPTQTRSSSPLQLNRFSDVKRIFNNFARSRQTDTYGQMHTQLDTTTPADFHLSKIVGTGNKVTPYDERQVPTTISFTAPECTSSDPLATPPLTPDSFDDHALPSPSLSDTSADIWNQLYPEWAKDQPDYCDEDEYPPSNSLEIQEGKRPERSIHHDAPTTSPQSPPRNPPTAPQIAQNALQDDEWYGLEYTLELSTRERRPSDTQSFSAGEHSKSRESWAAIHKGTIHPFFEDEDYYQWKNWHRYLDRQDERKRHRKGLEFKARAKDLAWYYADEMVTRDVMYWQKEVYGVIAKDIKERLATLAERRPDPYYPAKKHNHAWYLKRSRSVASLRELQPVPGHQRPNRDQNQAANFDEEDELAIESEIDDYSVFLED